jgi:hypothetical protein
MIGTGHARIILLIGDIQENYWQVIFDMMTLIGKPERSNPKHGADPMNYKPPKEENDG